MAEARFSGFWTSLAGLRRDDHKGRQRDCKRNGFSGRRPRLELLESRHLLSGHSIVLGPGTDFFDQPYVDVELIDRNDPADPGDDVGLGPYGAAYDVYPYKHMLLDTGANGILFAGDAVTDLGPGYVTEGSYLELGVGGYSEFDVSAPYEFNYSGSDPSQVLTLAQSTDSARIMSNPDLQLGGEIGLGGVPGVVGMPAMAGRVTTLDMSAWNNIQDLFEIEAMGVSFSDTAPGAEANRYRVPVDTRVLFDARDGLVDPDDPPPTWAPVPFLTAKAEYQGRVLPGTFLLDTGSQVTVISTQLAFDLGMDENQNGDLTDEALDFLDVGGVGGTRQVPIMAIERLHLSTLEGPDLTWADPTGELAIGVVVMDIADGIEGVLGVDLLTSGLSVGFDGENFTLDGHPYFDRMHFDFRDFPLDYDYDLAGNYSGTLYFDVNPAYAQLTPVTAGVQIVESGESTDVIEGGAPDTYRITLLAEPSAEVTIALAADDSLLVSPATLTFTPENWDTPQTVTVTAADDGVLQADRSIAIVHAVSSDDPDYQSVSVPNVLVQVSDATIQVSTSLAFQSGSGAGTYGGTTTLAAQLTAGADVLANQAVLFSVNDVVVGTANTDASGIATLTGVSLGGLDAGTYTGCVSASFLSDGIYAASTATTDLSVATAPLTVTVDNASKVFGQTLTAFTGTILGVQNEDQITATYTSDGAVSEAAAGQYAITATLNDPLGKLANYDVTIHPGTLTVIPAPTVTIAAPDDGYQGVVGQSRTFTFTASELAGPGGPFAYRIDWGDGSTLDIAGQPDSIQATHTFLAAGAYTVTARATDRDGATGPVSDGLLVNILVVEPQGQNVVIGGTVHADVFALTLGADPGTLSVQVGGDSYGQFSVGTTGSIQILGDGSADTLTLNGTSRNDQFQFDVAAERIMVGQVSCDFSQAGIGQISLDGSTNTDTITLILTSSADAIDLSEAGGTILGALGYAINLSNLEDITIDGNGGADTAILRDTASNDRFTANADQASHRAIGYEQVLKNFPSVTAYGGTGTDTAELYGSAGNDTFVARFGLATMASSLGYSFLASGFANQYGYGTHGGADTASLTGSDAAESFFSAYSQGSWQTRLTGGMQNTYAESFAAVTVDGRGGKDSAAIFDSVNGDVLTASRGLVQLKAPDFKVSASAFESVLVTASGGYDTAQLTDAVGNNNFVATPTRSILTGIGYSLRVNRFDNVTVSKVYGNLDTAYLSDSTGDDTFMSTPSYALLSGQNSHYMIRVKGFNSTVASATAGGTDVARLYGSVGAEDLTATNQYVRLRGSKCNSLARAFERVYANGMAGVDYAKLTDAVLTPGELDVSALPSHTQALWLLNFKKFILKSSSGSADQTVVAVDTVYTAYW